jgi:8-oxo-dGTP diphosphatase
MTEEIQVVAGICWEGGRFMAVRRPEGKPLAGFWEFPGGKVEPGESLEQALVREFAEELGLTPLRFSFYAEKAHAYPHLRVRVHFFQVQDFSGSPQALDGQLIRWFSPGQTDGTPFLPADTEIVAALTPNLAE